MASRSEFSAQTLSVLASLCQEPSQWQHGYALAKQTGLKSGTLYPILIRLADRCLVEACWQDEPQPGLPRRHLYRLTDAAMAVTTLGTGTTILMLKSPWLLHWLNHGRHLTAFATYRYELNTTNHTGAYVLMLMFFPVIGLITSYLAAVIANPAPLNARSPSPGLPMTSGE